MGRSTVTGRVAAVGALFLLLAGCPLDLRGYVEWLKVRDTLIPIEEIAISSAGDSFGMGSSPTETIQGFTYGVLMSKYEITNAQFRKFVEDGGYTSSAYWSTHGWTWLTGAFIDPADRMPLRWTHLDFDDPDQPVVGVSWYEAVAYCNWRSIREGFSRPYDATGRLDLATNGYRLPTEAEWEYAASKGEPGLPEWEFAYGPTADGTKSVNSDVIRFFPEVVGSKSPAGDTRLGLADMSGNVFEWCSDHSFPPVDDTDRYEFSGLGDVETTPVSTRGGSYKTLSNYTVTSNNPRFPNEREEDIGFRTAQRQ